MKPWAAIIVLAVGAGIWGWRLMPTGAPTESELRRTAGLNAEVLATRALSRGVEVTCRVSNATVRTAMHVVLNVALQNAAGRTLAANPLASVADLAAGQSRDAVFLVPFPAPTADTRAHAEVALVRWRE